MRKGVVNCEGFSLSPSYCLGAVSWGTLISFCHCDMPLALPGGYGALWPSSIFALSSSISCHPFLVGDSCAAVHSGRTASCGPPVINAMPFGIQPSSLCMLYCCCVGLGYIDPLSLRSALRYCLVFSPFCVGHSCCWFWRLIYISDTHALLCLSFWILH